MTFDLAIREEENEDLVQTEDPHERAPPIGVHLLDLKRRHCRAPLWGDEPPTLLYCGEPIVRGCSYCPEHKRQFLVSWS
jgi:hypothetical protein